MIEKQTSISELIEIKGVTGVYEVDADGFLLDSLDIGIEDKEAVAAVSAITTITSEKIGKVLGLGKLAWILLEFNSGKMIIARQEEKILVIITNNHVLLGDVIIKLKNESSV